MDGEIPLQHNQQLTNHGVIVTSADENSSCSSEQQKNDNDSESDDDEELPTHPDDLFDDQADEEDEAYVYKYMRSDIEETFTIRNNPTSQENDNNSSHNHHDIRQQGSIPIPPDRFKVQALKPRSSDAVLACPCCFNIVCMDCQRHERFKDQYRAMFVMSIIVRWDLPLTYDINLKRLVPSTIAHNNNNDNVGNRKEHSKITNDDNDCDQNNVHYYTVCCSSCETTVAALDMNDEVYHFHGCITSA